MKRKLLTTVRCSLFIILLAASSFTCAAQSAPQVLKVEPPNWWAGHSINPVRVLIRGKNLSGASVEAAGSGIRASNVKVNDAGTYLFVDVTIDERARAGRRALRIRTASGMVEAPFEISEPLARAGRFQGFTQDDVLYLIMTDRFSDGDPSNNDPVQSRGLYDRTKPKYYHGGDFQGVINHLTYLRELGVTAIWLTPWYDNVNHLNERETPEGLPITDYHGYGAVDFYGVEEHFGTMAKLRELVERAHRLGIKVIQDNVMNHTGPYHPWAEDEPTPTWYNGTVASHSKNPFQPWTMMDSHAAYQEQRGTLEGWFIDILPDLNQNDPETARYEIQNTLWWIGMTGVDGIREDTLPYVPRTFWRDWSAAIRREYPNFNVVGEMYDGDPALVSFFQKGRARYDGVDSGIDTLFDFPLLYPARRAFAEGHEIREVARMLAHDDLYVDPSVLVTFIGNHDMKRFMSEPGATYAGLKLAQTFLLTTRGIPQLYYGDEIGMTGADDPDNRRDFPGGFLNDPRDAFTRAGRSSDEQAVIENLRNVARLRAELEPLRRGALTNLLVEEKQYAFMRSTASASVIVLFNNDRKPATLEFEVPPQKFAEGALLIDRLNVAQDARVEGGKIKVLLPGRSAAILSVR